MKIEVGMVFKCPKKIAESGLLRIFGDQRHCTPNVLQEGARVWELLAYECDLNGATKGSYFPVTEKEIEQWNQDS